MNIDMHTPNNKQMIYIFRRKKKKNGDSQNLKES